MTPAPVPRVDGVPALEWAGPSCPVECDGQTLRMSALPRSDWFNDPASEEVKDNAAALVFVAQRDFTLEARVTVDFASTFDAGVLCLWAEPGHWAKLCFELSPEGEPMIVSVVTRGRSDDANSAVPGGRTTWLRVSRSRATYGFQYSPDGRRWHFVRAFRLGTDTPARVGYLAQSPTGAGCDVTFAAITVRDGGVADLRSGQ